jgi:hypothetical protein
MATYNCLTAQDYRYQASKTANEIESFMKKWEHWAEQLNTIPAQDLTELGLTEGEQTQMGSMRADVVLLVAAYRASYQTFIKRHAQLHLLG